MSTEVYDYRRFHPRLCLLFVVSFALFMLALRPTTVVQSLAGIAVAESTQELVRATLVAHADSSVASIVALDAAELPATPVPTLQDLVADSDPEIRLEAQTLLALVDAEVIADYRD